MTLDELFSVICDRRDHPTPNSYTAQLIRQGREEILKKIGEEAMEVILAGATQSSQRLVEEMADLYYHTLVMMASCGLTLQDIEQELEHRHR